MKIRQGMLSMAALLVVCTVQTGSAAKVTKLAVVDAQRLLFEYTKTRELSERFDREVARNQKQLEEMAQEVQSLRSEYQKSKAVLTDKARGEKEYLIQKKTEDLQAFQAQLRSQLDKKREELQKLLIDEIKGHIESAAKNEGYDAVYDKAAFLYIKEGTVVDITDKILESLDRQREKEKKAKKSKK